MSNLTTLVQESQPFYKIQNSGLRNLTNTDLLSFIISQSGKQWSQVAANEILLMANGNLSDVAKLSIKELTSIQNIGVKTAHIILTTLEAGRRMSHEDNYQMKVTCSRDFYKILASRLNDLAHEEVWVIFLNRANNLLNVYKHTQGGMASSIVDNRLIFKKGFEVGATSMCIAHNHPSKNLFPSPEDLKMTKKLKEAGNIVGITLLDSLIIGENNYYSFADEGKM